MRILQFDSVGGASGDMILGALINLGVDRDRLQTQLESLPLDPFTIEVAAASDHGLQGTRVTVHVGAHEHPDHHEHGGHHGHRTLVDIRRIVQESGLSDGVKRSSMAVFQRLAEAEARVHGTSPDDVHFHEVGAVDSIVDIVGGCLALECLGVDEIMVKPLPLGAGITKSQHGTIPVPAPATVELLVDFPVVQTQEQSELVTPTGAALLTTWRTQEQVPAGARVAAVGYGLGHRVLGTRPNLLRAILFETTPTAETSDECLVLECNLDDTVPELIGALFGRLLAGGALDVFTTPIQMKKQRPGILLSVLCMVARREELLDLIFRESTTFGVREYVVQRTMLARRHVDVTTRYGTVRVKVGTWKGEPITQSPEYEDCVRCAETEGVAVRAVYEAAQHAALDAPADPASEPPDSSPARRS